METTHEMLQVGEKNSHNRKTIMRGWHESRAMNLEEKGARFRGKIFFGLQNLRMTTRNTTKNLFRHPKRIRNEEDEPIMNRI